MFAGAEEAMFWALQELVGPGRHAVVDRAQLPVDGERPARDRRGRSPGSRSTRGRLGARPRRARRAAAARDAARRRQLPQQPDGRAARPGDVGRRSSRCARSAASGCSPTRSTAGWSRRAPRRSRRPPTVADRALARRDVQGLRPARPAHRLARLPRPRAARPAGDAQALHVDLQRRPERADRRRRPAQAGARSTRATARSSPRTCPSSTRSSPRHADRSTWEPPQAGCVCFPRYLGADGVEAFCHDLSSRRASCCCRSSIYASELGPVPADRFRIGVGRAEPGAGAGGARRASSPRR